MKKIIFVLLTSLIAMPCFAGQVTKPNTFSSGSTISSSDMNDNFDTIYNEFNGSVEGGAAGNIAADTLTEREMADEINPRVRWGEGFQDFVYTGLIAPTGAGLTANTSAGTVYVSGYRVNKASATAHIYTDEKETWVEINSSGTFNYQEQALETGEPSPTAGYYMLFGIAASGGAMVEVTDVRELTPYSTTNLKHYRKGNLLTSGTTADEDIVVTAGVLEIGGTTLVSTSNSSDLDVGTESFLSGATGTSQYIYIYAYNNSGSIGFKLSTQAPNLSDTSAYTSEIPYRYRVYSSTYYRCLGCVYQDAAGDLCWGQNGAEGMYVSQFDAYDVQIFNGLGTGSDQTINTIWTPKMVEVFYGIADSTPADAEGVQRYTATQKMLDTNWYGTQLNIGLWNDGGNYREYWKAITNAGSINAITTQAAGTAGSFTIDAMTDDYYWYAIAYAN